MPGDDEEAQEGVGSARAMLAPSNMAAHMRPELDPAEAADQYVTDGHERVPPDVLREALVFLEYANASYYIEVRRCACLVPVHDPLPQCCPYPQA